MEDIGDITTSGDLIVGDFTTTSATLTSADSSDTILTIDDSSSWSVDSVSAVWYEPDSTTLVLQGKDGQAELSTDGKKLFFNGQEIVTKNSLPKMEVTMFNLLGNTSFWVAVIVVLIVYNKLIAPRLNIKYLARKFYHLVFKPAKKAVEEVEKVADEAKKEFKEEQWRNE